MNLLATSTITPTFGRPALLLATILLVAPAFAAVSDTDTARLDSGYELLEGMCFACHSPAPEPGHRIAPPISAIKRHYSERYIGYSSFSKAIVDFVADPSADNAILRGAIKRFGLMPRLSVDTDSVADIAYYLYHAEIEDPAWFAQHYAAEHGKNPSTPTPLISLQDYRRHGQQLAMQTKAKLGSALKQALKSRGTKGAIDFCHTQAIPITESSAKSTGSRVYRVSDKPRNPDNRADRTALAIIEDYKAQMQAGVELTPTLVTQQQQVIGFYPIVTNGMCLQCHGEPNTEISASTLQAIDAKYPSDEATNYGDHELRGLFVVEMPAADQD